MKIQEAYHFFENLKNESNQRSRIKIYDQFLYILKQLQQREISTIDIQSIESELDSLNLNSNLTVNKRQLKKTLESFKSYLKENHSLTIIGHFEGVGQSMGVLFGVVLGVVIDGFFERSLGLTVGICVGLLVGTFVGKRLDSDAVAAGNVL